MTYKVSAHDITSISLNNSDYINSVLQNIAILLATKQESVPLYRGFGLPMKFVDKPHNIAKPMLIAEVTEAIMEFEPRASLVGITFEHDLTAPGNMYPIVEVEII